MSSTWTPWASSAATVRVAYTAPLAPVMPMAIDRRDSAPIQRHGQHDQVENPDVAIEIERPLHLRQIVGAHERLLVHQQRGDNDHAGEIERAERCDERQRGETTDR